MKEARSRLIHLAHRAQLSRSIIGKFIILDPSLKTTFNHSASKIGKLLQISQQKAMLIHRKIHQTPFDSDFKYPHARVKLVTIYDKSYPLQLKTIPDPPFLLYCLGDLSLFHKEKSISVIGTRKPSPTAQQKINHIVAPLVSEKFVIVSGLAYGVDSMAHRLALQLKGNTITVLGNGFNHIYPSENIPLFKQIMKQGLVVSEYAPNTPAQKYHFPERNRIISGLSRATLVVEALERSGTLITVDQALDQGRDVYAVPGHILDKQTMGCHKMIQDGAKLVISANDILEDF